MWRDEFFLYPYQDRASRIMQQTDVLLAFDMGCGKTPTTIHSLESMRGSEFEGCGTVVVPASLKWQWQSEVHKFSDQRAVVIDGSAKQRKSLYDSVRAGDYGYMILSYDTFVRDFNLHHGIARGFLVLDEATAIKNFRSQRSQRIKENRSLYPIKIALTGTPIENGQAEEIFSIMEFVNPDILGKYWAFEKRYIKRNKYGWIEGYRNLDEFHSRLKPCVVRATHKQPEVSRYLPKVLYRDPIMVAPDAKTWKAYRWVADDLLADLDSVARAIAAGEMDGKAATHPDGKVMAKIQAVRMLLDFPASLIHSATLDDGSAYARELLDAGVLDGLHHVPKLAAANEYILDHLDADPRNKVVVFASFIKVAEALASKHRGSALFHGNLTPRQRDAEKIRFQSDPSCRVFVSTDAGGYGLDLPQANLLINYDLPWQAGLLKQRNARIHRASSDWEYVVVQDFLVAGTLEERMRDMLLHKIAISEAIVDGEGITEKGDVDSELESLRAFLH